MSQSFPCPHCGGLVQYLPGVSAPCPHCKKTFQMPPAQLPPQPTPAQPVQAKAVASSPSSAPALWNPQIIAVVSLFLTWGVGAFLLSQNWKALGESQKAKRLMIWCYAFFGFLLVARLIGSFVLTLLVMWVVAGVMIVLEVLPQMTFIKEKFGEHYAKKPWAKPVAISIAALYGSYVVVDVVATVMRGR